jgi:hypothetical protein
MLLRRSNDTKQPPSPVGFQPTFAMRRGFKPPADVWVGANLEAHHTHAPSISSTSAIGKGDRKFSTYPHARNFRIFQSSGAAVAVFVFEHSSSIGQIGFLVTFPIFFLLACTH